MIPRELLERCVDQIERSATEVFGESAPYVVGEFIFNLIKNNEKLIEAMRSRDTLMKFLESVPDEYESRLPAFIVLCKLAPAIFEKDLMRRIYEIARENPAAAGRPPLVESKEGKRKIIMAVGQLLMDGCSLGDAQKRVADRYGIGVRTIEIIWRGRKKVATAEPRTIPDFISAVSRLRESAARLPEDEQPPTNDEPG